MKKIVTSIMWFAVAAAAFISCQKQDVEIIEDENVVSGLVFSSEKPAFDDMTKTEWTGETIKWSHGDKIRVAYTCDGVWQNGTGDATETGAGKFYSSNQLNNPDVVAKFSVPGNFTFSSEAIKKFYGLYPSALTSESDIKKAPIVDIIIPDTQTPLADSFDSSADVMVGTSAEITAIENESEISLKWNRIAAHAYITLSSLNGFEADENIQSISLTADDNANMVGECSIDLTTGAVEGSAGDKVTIKGSNLKTAEEGGHYNVTFWASFLPCTWTSLTVEVVTDKATYTREITGISTTFKQNARNILTIGMSEAKRVASDVVEYVLVEDASTITAGDQIIIVAKDYNYALSTEQKDNNRGAASVVKSEKMIVNPSADVQVLTVEAGTISGTFAFNTGSGYLYAASSNSNNLKTKKTLDDNGSWSITITDEVATIVANGDYSRNVLQYYNSGGSTLFSCYASDKPQLSISIYKLEK